MSKRPIPAIRLEEHYRELKQTAEQRGGGGLQEVQLEIAERHLANSRALAADFSGSAKAFSRYDNTKEHFHPNAPDRDKKLAKYRGTGEIRGTNAFAWRLKQQQTATWAGNSFTYVDREVWPARTPGGEFTDGRGARCAPRLDVLLAASDGTPIVGEVKVRGDQHPFYALIQLLMLAAQLATPNQLRRLRRWYPGTFTEAHDKLDLMILLCHNTDRGAGRKRLFVIAEQLGHDLVGCSAVSNHIGRITCLDVQDQELELRFTPRFPGTA